MRLIWIIICGFISLALGFSQSIEAPPEKAETIAGLCFLFLNLFWVIPYTVKSYKKSNYSELRISILIYLFSATIFYFLFIYHPSFNAQKWQTEIDKTEGYVSDEKLAANSAHKNGKMVHDLIYSKMLIGLTKEKVVEIMGRLYFVHPYLADDNISYYYGTNGKSFDGCNKVTIIFDNKGLCKEVSYMGCD